MQCSRQKHFLATVPSRICCLWTCVLVTAYLLRETFWMLYYATMLLASSHTQSSGSTAVFSVFSCSKIPVVAWLIVLYCSLLHPSCLWDCDADETCHCWYGKVRREIFFVLCRSCQDFNKHWASRSPSAKSAFLLYIYSDMDVFSDNEHHQHEVRIFAYCMELSKKDTLFVGSHSLAEHGKVPFSLTVCYSISVRPRLANHCRPTVVR